MKASQTAAKLTPWVRRALAHDPTVVRLVLHHSLGPGRGAVRLEPFQVPEPRPSDLTAEDVAAAIVEAATTHADSHGGRQAYEVTAHLADDDEAAVLRTSITIIAATFAAFDGTSEPTDTRGFGAMAARHSEAMVRSMLASNQATVGALTATLDRLSSRLERAESRVESLSDRLYATTEARLGIEAERAQLVREREDVEADAEIKVKLWGLLEQMAPALLPLAMQAGQKLLAAPKKSKPKRKAKAKRRTAGAAKEVADGPERH